MAFDFTTLVTDRTEADFKRWEYLRNKGFANMTDSERAEWLAGNMKGAYNISDLNRVGEALFYLQNRLKKAGYITYQTQFHASTGWTEANIISEENLKTYLKGVSNIRNALTLYESTPPAPENTGALNIEEANNIEKILLDVETLINNMLDARFYCGDVYSGEI